MTKGIITKFKITKLFGYQNVDIDFEDNKKILIGENGLGKTTILNVLYFILNKKFKKLDKVKFESIELHFSNKSKVYLTKNDLSFYVKRPSRTQGTQLYHILKEKLKKNDIEKLKQIILDNKSNDQHKRFSIVEILKSIDVNIKAPNQFIYDSIVTFINEFEAANFQDVIDVIDKNIKSKILYFPTYRRIETDFEKLIEIKRQSQIQQSHFWEDEVDNYAINEDDHLRFGMEDVQTRIDNLTEEIRETSLKGFSKITGGLLSQLSNEFKNYKLKNKLDFKKLEIILERVGDSISLTDKDVIKSYIISGNKNNKGLLCLIDQLIDLYNQQEKLDVAIKNFSETCNNYLNSKKFVYDESSISLNIYREKSDEIILLEQLSSGEKQIVSLFSKIFLELDESFIILFDEPELSLSIYWQQKLLPHIINSNKCIFLLAVTHSPFIYDNELQSSAFGLTDYINFKNESTRTTK
ncbi:AAA family ATPase [Sphingobacterium sp. BIGb0116]|uniref:AAA family ATPase n=1 Tax=Sphingobacterium sp. BIGb0116 TaxID=2940619 RepID=UPI002168546F|nr:AAA family ATPase [Sphingobacterium sp. BIGb0116]MCS4167645.1 ABC-type cobalamin/Fe3+-siderophores transport system ATPase subunit [Sphingobacterium sp. BIGb0116]